MLVLPLHRRLTRDNFPFVTVALILINCFVFMFLQSGDARSEQRAVDYYASAQLGKIEFPEHAKWLREHDASDDQRVALAERAPPVIKLALIESDRDFLAALHADKIVEPTRADYADWHDKRAEFERLRDSSFTAAHVVRFSHVEPGRMIWAMFLHGGWEHLIGNMIFLALIGILVEGALGALGFVALYVVGGLCAQLASLGWHWGQEGTALGASGAIAALMGAYCVLWAGRKVRVFYWFFVVFDYVRVPALLLLPLWLGWELLNLLIDRHAHVAFEAHAGGIMAGALLAFGLRRANRVRDDFITEDERVEQRANNAAAFDEALAHLGRLEIPKARAILERIDAEEPGQLRVLVALYRCARYGGTPAQLDAAATRVLGFAIKTDADLRELRQVCEDYLKACAGAPRLAPELLLRLAAIFVRNAQDGTAEALLRAVAVSAPSLPALPAAWFALALRTPEGTPQRRARLEYIVRHYANSEFAPKARFLLQPG